jgi:ankyrin repeat protein
MAVEHGNLPLGQVYKLLISIIGRDAALTIAEDIKKSIVKKNPDKNYKDPNKKFTDIKRFYEEDGTSFAHFRPSEETGAMELVRNFFQLLKKQYGFPENVRLLTITAFFGVYRNALRALTPYEKQTKDMSLHLFNWFLGYLGTKSQNPDNQEIYTISKNSVKELLNDSYDLVFDEIYKNLEITKTKFYEEVKKFYNRKPLADFEQALKRSIDKCCKNNTNEPWIEDWNKFKAILDFINKNPKGKKKLIHRLIGLYLFINAETALKEVCGIEQKDIYNVKQDILKWAQDELSPPPKSESQCFLMISGKYNPTDLSILQNDFIDPDFQEQITAIQECRAYLWGKTAIEYDVAERLIQTMEGKCPNCGIFFASWARARLAVLSCKFDGNKEDEELKKETLKGYHTAFAEGRNFAGAYLKAFLEESIATTVYFDRKETKDIPDVIDTDKKDTTPITKGAKQYYEYGYALNLLELKSSKTFSLHFNAREHFWKVFPVSLFTHGESVRQYKFTEDVLKARWWFHFLENMDDQNTVTKMIKKIVDNSFDSIKHTKELQNKSKDTINDRMDLFLGYDIQYTPLTIALMTRQLDIVEIYLEHFADCLDDAKINTDGSTALLESILQYKLIRFLDRKDQDALSQAQKYKEIILKLIDRSPFDALYSETVTNYISVLEEAINSFDIDIVKAIVDKKGFDINRNVSLKDSPPFHISADELSPLYYAVQRMNFVNQAIQKGHIDSLNGNINYTKLNVQGIFPEDKQSYLKEMKTAPLLKITEPSTLHQFVGVKSVWKQEFKELKEIVKYLMEKTDDVDKFAKEVPDGTHTTTLTLAVESDFDDICRLLIEKGANPACPFVNNNKPPPYSYIFHAAWYKSWKTLEMLLTDYKDKIKPIINHSYLKLTAAHLLFKDCRYLINYENFKIIEKFIPLFRNADADFGIPDIDGITVRQILREHKLEDLIYLIKT